TQDAVLPGHRYTYTFVAREAGTYWYHPHQMSDQELGKGLYGALVVLPRRDASPAVLDRVLFLGDWPLSAPKAAMPPMPGMAMGETAAPVAPATPPALRPYLADTGMAAY